MKVTSIYDLQLVRGSKRQRAYIRAVPYTIFYPTVGQIITRIRFGRIAKLAKLYVELTGEKFKDGLPIAAWLIKKYMKGTKAPVRKYGLKVWERRLLMMGLPIERVRKIRRALVRLGLVSV